MSTSETTKVDRQPSTADEIVQPIIPDNATGDLAHDLNADDQRWIETVMASLQGRSRAAREVLAAVLIDGAEPVRRIP